MYTISCPKCRATYTVDASQQGQKFDCAACKQRFEVPPAPSNKTILANVVPPPPSGTSAPIPFVLPAPASPPDLGWFGNLNAWLNEAMSGLDVNRLRDPKEAMKIAEIIAANSATSTSTDNAKKDQRCSSCGGTGNDSSRCGYCGGTGVSKNGVSCGFCNGRRFNECMLCRGTGRRSS